MEAAVIFLAVFVMSLLGVLVLRRRKTKEDEVGAQFVLTGTLLLFFYIVCFCSAVCTILNFLFRWIF